MKYIYVTSTQATLTLGMTGSHSNANINLYAMDGTNTLQQNPTTPVAVDDAATNTSENVYNSPSGRYMAVFTLTAGTPTAVNIQTDPYSCFYNYTAALKYTDKYDTF